MQRCRQRYRDNLQTNLDGAVCKGAVELVVGVGLAVVPVREVEGCSVDVLGGDGAVGNGLLDTNPAARHRVGLGDQRRDEAVLSGAVDAGEVGTDELAGDVGLGERQAREGHIEILAGAKWLPP
jgi:hypothetical protein